MPGPQQSGNAWTSANIPANTRAVVSVQMITSLNGYATGAYDLPIVKREQNHIKSDIQSILKRSHILRSREIKLGKSLIQESYRALFLKTTDGGVNWFTYGQDLDSILYFHGAIFLDENIGYAITGGLAGSAGSNGKILKTTDGGLYWSQQNTSDPDLYLTDIDFIDINIGIATGYKFIPNDSFAGIIMRTLDGGKHWESDIYPENEHFSDIKFSSTNEVYTIAHSHNVESIIYKSVDGGISWDSVLIIASPAFLEGFDFIRNSDVGIAYGAVSEPDTLGTSHIKPIILSTLDGGENWSVPTKFDSLEGSFLFGSKMYDENIWYLCGGYPALVLKTTNGGVSFVEEDQIDEIPSNYILSQNYPNPFNPFQPYDNY